MPAQTFNIQLCALKSAKRRQNNTGLGVQLFFEKTPKQPKPASFFKCNSACQITKGQQERIAPQAKADESKLQHLADDDDNDGDGDDGDDQW